MWIDPSNGDRLFVSNDGGVGISINRGKTWSRVQFPNAQIYHVATDNQIPYYVYGNRQDGPSFRGPSNSRIFGYGQFVPQISRDQWVSGGGESGWTIPDPVVAGRLGHICEERAQLAPCEIGAAATAASHPRPSRAHFDWKGVSQN
jgi:hypothetical protein